jgi:hypothetical protein
MSHIYIKHYWVHYPKLVLRVFLQGLTSTTTNLNYQEEHICHLMEVLETLKKHQILNNLKKCKFCHYLLMYLWYVIGGGEQKVDPTKVEDIIKWLVPTNVTEVRSFFGES